MFRKNNVKIEQQSLLSKEHEWSDYKLTRLQQSWAGVFRKQILPHINEDSYSVLYSDKASRPNTPVNYLVGLLIIKSIQGLSDEELLDAALYNEMVQYALGTLDYVDQPISKNMISNFRVRLYEYSKKTGIDLFENTMREINEELISLSKIDKSLNRIDSLMISSSCKRMARSELIYTVNERFIKLLNKLNKNIDEEFKAYLEEDNSTEVLYRTKETEIGGKLTLLLNHSIKLYNDNKDDADINCTEEFNQLKRLIDDQYDSTNSKPKDGKDIKPTSLQTPYDAKATYRYKYQGNVGYVGNVVETVDQEKELSLITYWSVAPNIKSDTEFMEEIIDAKEGEDVVTEITDAAYISAELIEKAEAKNIILHPTDLTGKKDTKETNLSKFKIDENNNITKCPNEIVPTATNYNNEKNKITAEFDKHDCATCSQRDKCPIVELKRKNKLSTTIGQIKYAQLKENRNLDEYKEISKLRSAIEGIPSILRRKYRIDERPTKGVSYLKMVFSTSILSINIKRIAKYERNHLNNDENNTLITKIYNTINNLCYRFI